jgi:hypothetical protein
MRMPAGTEKPQAAGPQGTQHGKSPCGVPAGASPGRGLLVAAAAVYAVYLIWLIVTAVSHRFF